MKCFLVIVQVNHRSMPKRSQRDTALDHNEKRHFVEVVIPGRIGIIEKCLKEVQPSDPLLAAAAIHTRALAGFLGIGVKSGGLRVDNIYYDHGNGSFEVKISDIKSDSLYSQQELDALCQEDRDAICKGMDGTNREFAHLTYWRDPANQDSSGVPNEAYRMDLTYRVRSFAQTIIRLLKTKLPAS